MPFTLRQYIPQHIKAEIQKYQHSYGQKLFQQRLHHTAYQNMTVDRVHILTTHKYLQIYRYIQQWTITEFTTPQKLQPYSPCLLKVLSCIKFTNLKTLTLSNLKINNIEPLGWLDSPQIQRIILENNNIVSVKPLMKAYFPKILQVAFFHNSIKLFIFNQYDELTRSYSFYNMKIQLYQFQKIRDRKKYMFFS